MSDSNDKNFDTKYSIMNEKKLINKKVVINEDNLDEEEYEEEYNAVNDCVFWHIKTSIDNVFNTGMLVEIEHSVQKYWLATVVDAFGQLLSLKWEGAIGEPDFWFDLKTRKIYPVGYYRDKRDFKIEPPLNLKLETKNIVDVTVKYFSKNQSSNANCVKLNLFTKYGFTNLTDIFMPKSIVLEIALEFEPNKYWFATVVDNFGGRLALKWIQTLDSNQENSDDSEECFHLYFCSPRVSYLGFTQSKAEENYIYCPPNESIVFDEEIVNKYLNESTTELNQSVKDVILLAKEFRPQLYKSESLSDIEVNDKVLIFPNKLLKLLPATVESVSANGQHMIIECDSDPSIRFCYPNHDNYCILPLSWAEENQISADFGEGGLYKYMSKTDSKAAPLVLQKDTRIDQFESNTRLEVIHPKDNNKICEGIIIRITPPLIWIEISSDLITVLPYNSTDIYPLGWSNNNGIEAINLLTENRKSKSMPTETEPTEQTENLDEENSSQIPDSPSMSTLVQCSSKSWCPRIFINHKCFTGPALSKSKICELPQYVGPGPITLVLQEVISKIIAVAYVPNRVLNELSSQTFQELLKKKEIKKADDIEFKAKYQKRTYRDNVLVARNADQVEEYCRCVCGHLKCCYNLFSPFQYSGDDCPSNCRGLTKSNKYLKRAGYYRDKARHNRLAQNKKKMTLLPTNEDNDNNDNNDNEDNCTQNTCKITQKTEDLTISQPTLNDGSSDESVNNDNIPNDAEELQKQQQQKKQKNLPKSSKKSKNLKSKIKRKRSLVDEENDENEDTDNPLYWSISDVHDYLKKSNCFMFAPTLREHEVDGAALLLLTYSTITSLLFSGYTRQYCMGDASKLAALVESLRHKWARIVKKFKK